MHTWRLDCATSPIRSFLVTSQGGNVLTTFRRLQIYRRLNSTCREIRLLEFVDCDTHDVSVNLRRVSLDDTPTYETLSYTWGGYGGGRSILVSSIYRLAVTDNVYNALRRLRGRRPVLWIDALCINQHVGK
jgi:hypothetical protein